MADVHHEVIGPVVGPRALEARMPGFTSTGDMSVSRRLRSAALLADGRVLVAGGRDPQDLPIPTAEVYDPQSGTWSSTGQLARPRDDDAVVVAVGGGAAVIGGDPAGQDTVLEVWSSDTGQWTATIMPPFMSGISGAWEDGDHLLVLCRPLALLDDMEFRSIDLTDGQVRSLASPIIPRHQSLTCRLSDGRILLAAGLSAGIGSGGQPVEYLSRECEVYDPAADAWQPVGDLAVPHLSTDRSGQSLVALPDGGALMVSGSNPGVDPYTPVVERWSATTGAWSLQDPLTESRDVHTTTLIDDHTVLVVGGEGPAGPRSDCHTYDLGTHSWSAADALSRPRLGHVAVALGGSRLLVIDGAGDGSCEMYG